MVKRQGLMMAAVCTLMLTCVGWVHGQTAEVKQVLSLAPAKSPMVVVVRDLSALDKQLNGAMQQMANAGLPVMPGMFSFKQMLDEEGMGDVIDVKSPIMLAMTKISKHGDGDPVLVFKPADADKLAENKKHDFHYKMIDGWVVSCESEEKLNAYVRGNQAEHFLAMAGKLNQDVWAKGDLVGLVDVAALPKITEQQWQKLGGEFDQLIRMHQAQGDLNAMASMMVIRQLMISQGPQIIAGTQSAVGAYSWDDKGFGVIYGVQFKADSDYAKWFAAAPAGNVAMNHLPSQPVLLAGAMDLNYPQLWQIWIKAIEAVEQDAALPAEMKPILVNMKMQAKAGMMISSSEFAWLAPAQFSPATLFQMFGYYQTKDPGAVMQSNRDSAKMIVDAMQKLTADGKTPPMIFDYKVDGVQIDGMQADVFSLRFPQQMVRQMGPAAMFLAGGFNGFVVQLDKGIAAAMTRNPQTAGQWIAGAKAGEGKLADSPAVKLVQPMLPANRCFEMYVDTASILKLVQSGMQMMQGVPAAYAVPADVPAIGMVATHGEGAVRFEAMVPKKAMDTWIEMAGATMQQMQQQQMPPQ